MARYAAIDCGTNSLRLLISEDNHGRPREIVRLMEIVRLGQGVDATGEFAPEALERTRKVLTKYVDLMQQERVQDVRMVATSATRDARNKDEFFAMTAELLGQIRPGACAQVITGEEEAKLSFIGAVAYLSKEQGPFCVIDLGGGSTEFVVGVAGGQLLGSYSSQMGCVRISERIMQSDPRRGGGGAAVCCGTLGRGARDRADRIGENVCGLCRHVYYHCRTGVGAGEIRAQGHSRLPSSV